MFSQSTYKKENADLQCKRWFKLQNDSLSSRLSIIQPILTRFLKEHKKIEEVAKREGKVPKQLCKLCSRYGLHRTKTIATPLRENELTSLVPFLKWMRDNRITSVRGQFYGGTGSIDVEAKELIGKKKPKVLKKGAYTYNYPLSEIKKRSFYNDLIVKYDGLQSCPHFNSEEPRVVHLFKQESRLGTEYLSHSLFFCCDKCSRESEEIACEGGVVKEGFIYRVHCDLNSLVLEKILKEEKIEYEKGEREESIIIYPYSSLFYLRDPEILIDMSTYPRGLDETTISVLKPKLIVCLGEKSRIVELLEHSTDILVASEEGFYIYDHTRPVEESVDAIANIVVEKLDDYAEMIRGNEHDRLVKAFEKIGRELGYVPQREYGRRGLRVDCVWYDRQGNIRVAIEVETRGGWKKDILSTWELEPQLSIITTHQKTDSVPKALMDFALMKSIPHRLLYINMETKNAYLFEKQETLKKYSLQKEKKEDRFSLTEV